MADMDVDTPAPAQEVVKKAKGKDSGKARFEVKKVSAYYVVLWAIVSHIRRTTPSFLSTHTLFMAPHRDANT